jgi:hypothetical protein
MKKKKENPPIIQSLWIGDELCHPFHLFTYKEIKGVPDKVIINDANMIIPEDQVFKYKDYDSFAGFANLFRYKLLLEKGGFWVDADVVCLKPFQFLSDYVFASEVFSLTKENGATKQVTNCVIKVPAGSRIMEYCYEQALAKNPIELNWGETGPKLLSNAVLQQFKMGSRVVAPKFFCPIPFIYWQFLINDMPQNDGEDLIVKMTSESFAIHLYHEMWRRNNIDKNGSFSPSSIYEKLKKRYLL